MGDRAANKIINWLRRQANAEKEPTARATFIEAHNAARMISAMTSSHKDVPEYDEDIVCEAPECKHLGAPAITGLYGMAGGGGLGVYSVCEHCGTVLSKSLDPEMCETHNTTEIKDEQAASDIQDANRTTPNVDK